MTRFGMVLSEGTPLHDPVWGVFTPEAEALNGAGTFKVHMAKGATGGLDNSPPDRKPHFEYNSKELAVAAVRSPELFAELAQKVDSLIQTLMVWLRLTRSWLVYSLKQSVQLARRAVKKASWKWSKQVCQLNPTFNNALMAVKTCSKALLTHSRGHGKSPCFYKSLFCGCLVLITWCCLLFVDGQENME